MPINNDSSNNNNSPNNNNSSDIQQAVKNADPKQIKDNLANNDSSSIDLKDNDKTIKAQSLTTEQTTPFIDEKLRTDK
jgi:hypothetical protein